MGGKNQFGIDPESVVDFVINGETTSENPADTGDAEKVVTPAQENEQQTNDCSDSEQKTEGSSAPSEPGAAPASSPQEDVVAGEVKAEIEKLGKDGGYTMIFDSSAGMILHAAESENLMTTLKSKLGVN